MDLHSTNHSDRQRKPGKLKLYFRSLGPGLITGASDDDPSGIGTYSQTGALFGYTQLWTAVVTFPLMAAVQEICARIALQSGGGLANNIRKHYPRPVLYVCVLLLVFANTINIGTDLGAMVASAKMMVRIPFVFWIIGMTALVLALEIFIEYRRYAKILRFLTLSLFAYAVVVFVVPQHWEEVLRNTLIPTVRFKQEFLLNLVAVFGTTISPYLFFWQASQEVEEEIARGKTSEAARRGVSKTELKWMRTDVVSGMFFSNIIMWFIIITTGSTLFRSGFRDIDSAPRAAEALRPLAGDFAYLLFAAGIIGTGLLAIPILAGSAAYAVAETFRWREGLYLKFRQAPGFYGIIAVATLIGVAINLTGLNPIRALYYTAVLNGVVAPPLLVMIMLISNNPKIMADRANGRISNFLGWLVTAFMTLAAVALLITTVK